MSNRSNVFTSAVSVITDTRTTDATPASVFVSTVSMPSSTPRTGAVAATGFTATRAPFSCGNSPTRLPESGMCRAISARSCSTGVVLS